mmetsp:Transcript_13691/g.21382  ORF Transcript_13691/g.21382 Transcript_13691/m.21382 type:complete len:184 (+) Transcript_13691:949-1500(+)
MEKAKAHQGQTVVDVDMSSKKAGPQQDTFKAAVYTGEMDIEKGEEGDGATAKPIEMIEEEEDEDFGMMIDEMNALMTQPDITPVAVDKDQKEEDEEDPFDDDDAPEVSVHQRIEELRMHLENRMGFDQFLNAYQYMKTIQDQDDEEMVSAKITELMGEGNQATVNPSLLISHPATPSTLTHIA